MSDTDPAAPADTIRSLVAATRATTKAQRERDQAEAKLAEIDKATRRAIEEVEEFGTPGAAMAGLTTIELILLGEEP